VARGGLDDVLDPERERHPAVRRLVAHQHAAAVALDDLRVQHPVAEGGREPRVLEARRSQLVARPGILPVHEL
jgi:hypothetical protein